MDLLTFLKKVLELKKKMKKKFKLNSKSDKYLFTDFSSPPSYQI